MDPSDTWDRRGVDGKRLPHHDSSTWFMPIFSRTDAEQLLSNKQDGTFLVRLSHTGEYALSITCNGKVNHCLIREVEGKFGFAEPAIHDSLSALVLFHSRVSLAEFNEALNTALAYPVFVKDSKE